MKIILWFIVLIENLGLYKAMIPEKIYLKYEYLSEKLVSGYF